MKKSSLILAVCLAFACQPKEAQEKTDRAVEDQMELVGNFGAPIREEEAVTTAEMVRELRQTGSFSGRVAGKIVDVCTKKGCWMTLELPGEQLVRVTFKDYGFFVPTDAHGAYVVMEGVGSIQTTDVATLRHYAEDAGASEEEIAKITSDKEELSFEAHGVIVKTAKS